MLSRCLFSGLRRSGRRLLSTKQASVFVMYPELPVVQERSRSDVMDVTNECRKAAKLTMEFECEYSEIIEGLRTSDNVSILAKQMKSAINEYALFETDIQSTLGRVQRRIYCGPELTQAELDLYRRVNNLHREVVVGALSDHLFYTFCKEYASNSDELDAFEKRFAHLNRVQMVRFGQEVEKQDFDLYHLCVKQIPHWCEHYRRNIYLTGQKFGMRDMETENRDEINAPDHVMQMLSVDRSKPPRSGPWGPGSLYTPSRELSYRRDLFLRFCTNREMRKLLIDDWNETASSYDGSPEMIDNRSLIEKLRQLRWHFAYSIGFDTFFDSCLTNTMAGSTANVLQFIETLRARGRARYDRDYRQMEQFAAKTFGIKEIQVYDADFVLEMFNRNKYKINENTLKQLFPIGPTLEKLFEQLSKLFGLKFERVKVQPEQFTDVLEYQVFDAQITDKSKKDTLLGTLLVDVYAPKDDANQVLPLLQVVQPKREVANEKPIICVYINKLETPWIPLKSVDEVNLPLPHLDSLIRKVGASMAHFVTRSPSTVLCGPHTAETDVVNVLEHFSAQFFLHCPERLRQLSTPQLNEEDAAAVAGYAKNRLHNLLLDLYWADIDYQQNGKKPSSYDLWHHDVHDTWKRYFPIPPLQNDHRMCNMPEMITSETVGSTYADRFSEMIAHDLVAAFNEVRTDNVAELFRREVLENIGCAPFADIFRTFRGRDPTLSHMCSYYGLESSEKSAKEIQA